MENIDKRDKYYIQRTRGAGFPRFMVGLTRSGTLLLGGYAWLVFSKRY